MIKVIDSHAHLSHSFFDKDRDEVIDRAFSSSISFLEVATDLESSKDVLRVAREYGVPCALGLHPHSSGGGNFVDIWGEIENLLDENKDVVAAVGETGLDYFRNLSPKNTQIESFETGLGISQKKNLPVIVHQRDAQKDAISVLKNANITTPVVFHCFQGNIEEVKECLRFDGYFGLGGSLTYPKNQDLRDAVRYMPKERILLETDCPYLPPQERRGQRNEPYYMLETLSFLAEVLGVSKHRIAKMTYVNTKRVFGEVSAWN